MESQLNEAKELWSQFIAGLEGIETAETCDMFFKPMVPLALEDKTMTLAVDTPFIKDWIMGNYAKLIEDRLSQLHLAPITIKLVVDPELHKEEKAAAKQARTKQISAEPEQSVSETKEQAKVAAPVLPTREDPYQTLSGRVFNPNYTFNSFVMGDSNHLALAAANAVAEKPGQHYNPLFIYGGVGIGKTHLLHAIGQFILLKRPQTKIIYCSGSDFVQEVVEATTGCGKFDNTGYNNFVQKYRNNCDVLLIDDIQFISGKERTQTELFHIFNFLYEAGKQIVVTSDKLPQEIPDLAERLRSRFQCGLIADIQNPELDTRVSIIMKKAKDAGFSISNDVAMYIAKALPANVRILEGALKRVMAHSTLTGRPLTLDYAKQILADVCTTKTETISVEDIQKAVSDFYHLDTKALSSSCRTKAVARPRQVAMYLCRKHINASFPALAKEFKRKDHTTVMSACKKIASLLGKEDEELIAEISSIERALNK